MGFVKVTEISEVPIGKMKLVNVNENELLLSNIDGNYYAIGNRCTHRGGDLSKGTLEGNVVTCPRHGAKYDVTTGKVIEGPKILFLRLKNKDEPSYKVKVEGNDVYINLD